MITVPTYIDVPEFATLGTKVEPDASIFTNGYAVDTILPTEHLSYFFNGFTSNDITQEDSIDALIVELNSILTAAGLTPNPLLTDQILSSLNILYVKASGGSSLAGTTTVTGTITSSGGTLSGSWAGNPTFSGTPVFSSGASMAGVFSGTKSFSGTNTITGTLTSSGGTLSGSWSGGPTFSGDPIFSGTNTVTGTLASSGGTISGSWAGNPTFSGDLTAASIKVLPLGGSLQGRFINVRMSGSQSEDFIFDSMSPYIALGDRMLVSGSIVSGASIIILSDARRTSSTVIDLSGLNASSGAVTTVSITNGSGTSHNVSLCF